VVESEEGVVAVVAVAGAVVAGPEQIAHAVVGHGVAVDRGDIEVVAQEVGARRVEMGTGKTVRATVVMTLRCG
jgi:hypothetical protein